MKKNLIKYIFASLLLFPFTACEDYLDKSPDADISEEDVFKKFYTFQGYVEDIYQCLVCIGNRDVDGMGVWNFGDDVVGYNRLTGIGLTGNYYEWAGDTNSSLWLSGGNASDLTGNKDVSAGTGRAKRGYWDHGWLGIRKANIALENLDLLVEPFGDATIEEQRDLIEGQALFFRGYFHFEIMRSWGGVPYIDQSLTPDMTLDYPRLSYAETAERAAADFEAAAKLLPDDWDNTTTGKITLGSNEGRLTKGAAYAYLGINWLYAASPLMNGSSTGSYTYNEEYCKKAIAAFHEVIKLDNSGIYELEPWETYCDNFYRTDGLPPYTDETIFKNPVYGDSRWNKGSEILKVCGGWDVFSSPTENYVENFGMANGLPIDQADSGYDPSAPWENEDRDPRFYYNILVDREHIIELVSDDVVRNYAELYTGGNDRLESSVTGYGFKKFHHRRRNTKDDGSLATFFMQVTKMRLADVYLMYAEAVNEVYGPTTVPTEAPSGLTAAQAVNKVRARAGVPDVDARYHSEDAFREVVRQERAVELCFEGHRWYDLRRWYVAHEAKYRELYSLEFDAEHTYFTKKLYQTKIFETKHYWLPFDVGQVSLYTDFYQNPGW